ncbi:MAG: amidohydrolase [Conexivisphaerales archaeon]
MKFVNGRIFGYDEDADCVGVERGKIVYVGKDRNQQAKKEVDLQGRALLPGFIDSHTHLVNLGSSVVDLAGIGRQDVIEKMIEAAKKVERRVVVGRGWDESQWKDRSYLTRSEVDEIPKPAILIRRDGHMAVANSKALDLLGMAERKDGILREGEMKLVRQLQHQDSEEIKQSLLEAFSQCFMNGVTCVRDIVDKATFDAYSALRDAARPKVRLAIYHDEYEDYMARSDNFWGVKVFLDGSIGAKTAAVSSWPTENLLVSEKGLRNIAERFWRRSLPVAAHAIGDVAIDTAIRVLSLCKDKRIRNSIEHFELVRDEFLEEIKSLAVCCQPNFLQWSKRGGLYDERLGGKWLGNDNPYRLILDRAILLAFGSDCMPFGPNYGIHLAVNSEYDSQRISLEEAIGCYTKAGAELCYLEKNCGAIKVGMDADMVIMEEKYFSEKEKIKEKKPVATFLRGELVYGDLSQVR